MTTVTLHYTCKAILIWTLFTWQGYFYNGGNFKKSLSFCFFSLGKDCSPNWEDCYSGMYCWIIEKNVGTFEHQNFRSKSPIWRIYGTQVPISPQMHTCWSVCFQVFILQAQNWPSGLVTRQGGVCLRTKVVYIGRVCTRFHSNPLLPATFFVQLLWLTGHL